MPSILTLALPLALLGAAGAKLATRLPERAAARRQRRESDRNAAADAHAAAQPRSLDQVLERDGLRPAVELAISRGRTEVRELQRDGQALDAERQREQDHFDAESKEIIETHGGLPRIAALALCSVLFVVISGLLLLLVHGILLVLLNGDEKVAAPLALVDVILIAVLGLFVHESIHPTGAIPGWRERTAADRAPVTVFLLVLLGAFLVVSARLAPARADVIHRPRVAAAEQTCRQARAAETDGGSAETSGVTVACDRADQMRATYARARLWDQTAAITLPLAEIVTAAFALQGVILLGAYRVRRRLRAVEAASDANARAIESTTDLVIDDLTEVAIRAGFTARDVDAELVAMGVQPPARVAEPGDADGEAGPEGAARADADDPRHAPMGAYAAPGAGAGADAEAGADDDPDIDPAPPADEPVIDLDEQPGAGGGPVRHDDETPDPEPADEGVPAVI